MDNKRSNRPLDLVGNGPWYEEFGLIPRFPRPPLKQIVALIEGAKEPEIFLTLGEQSVDVVIRMHAGANPLPLHLAEKFVEFDATLPKSFEDILWQKLDRRKNKTWVELARLATQAYFETWNHWADVQYLGHFHPVTDEMFNRIKKDIKSAAKKAKRGRKSITSAEFSSLVKRFRQLLPKCELIYEATCRAASSAQAKNNFDLARKEIRGAVWKSVRSEIHGMQGDGYIFSGEAFKRIRSARKSRRGKALPVLHDPTTWKPRQLAISILSRERELEYETTQKKLAGVNGE